LVAAKLIWRVPTFAFSSSGKMSDFESEDEIDPIAMLRRPAYLKKPHVVSLADK
jgi:hypothetical protein